MKSYAVENQTLLIKAFSRKVFQSLPAIGICLLLSVTVIYTVKRPKGMLDGYVVNTNMNLMRRDLAFLLDDKSKSIQAEFKGTQNNEDGSVNLIFRVVQQLPRTADAEQAAPDKHLENKKQLTKPAVKYRKGAVPLNLHDPSTNVQYPSTLDADFLINTVTPCPKEKSIDYIIVVHSATAYFKRRRDIRETFGGTRVIGTVSHALVFLLGATSDPVTTRLIQQEALQYGDIVQGPFKDSYHNLTHKAVMGLRWLSTHCSQAKVVVKIDDDTFVNTFKLVDEMLPKYSSLKRHIACHVRKNGTSLINRGKSKWHVSENEFKGYTHFPFPYCNGYFVVMSGDLVQPLLKAAYVNPFFWIDDVYVYGLLPQTVGNVTFDKISNILNLKYKDGKDCLASKGLSCEYIAISQYSSTGMETLWYSLLSKMTDSSVEKYKLFNRS